MYSVQFTETAEDDIIETVTYLSDVLKSPGAAKQLVLEIEDKIRVLETMPFCNALLHDEYLQSKGIRSLLVKKYHLFYSISEFHKEVTILRILYARRDWESILRSE